MAENEAAEAAPKKKSKLLLIIIIAVVALGGAGAGAYMMLKPSDDKAATAEAEKAEPGEVVKVEPVTINLADGHYLKMAFALQATADAAEAPDGSKALDLAISLYSNQSSTSLLTKEGRDKSKEQLKEQVIKAYTVKDEEEIMDVYFTTFVIQ